MLDKVLYVANNSSIVTIGNVPLKEEHKRLVPLKNEAIMQVLIKSATGWLSGFRWFTVTLADDPSAMCQVLAIFSSIAAIGQ